MKRVIQTTTLLLAFGVVTQSAAAQGRGWQEIECELSTSHYLVNSALSYLRNSARTRFADQRDRDLRDAQRVLNQALEQGRDGDPAVWYFYGRYYKQLNDLTGADSMFTRAESMAPQCRDDIAMHRRQLWVPIINRGVQALREGDEIAARDQFVLANTIFKGDPSGFYYLAQIYATAGHSDSAVQYYRQAIAVASDSANAGESRFAEIRERSVYNVARLFHRAEQYDSAIAWYERYRRIDPNDAQALTGLAQVLGSAGRGDAALAIYDSVLARADSLPPFDLFQAGVALFNAKRYARAAEAFETALARNEYFRMRETLFNLANTYLSMGSADSGMNAAQKRALQQEYAAKMAPVVQRLVSIDPASLQARRLMAAVYQLRNLPDSTLAVLERAQAMKYDVTVSTFAPAGSDAWDVRGLITNNAESGPVSVPELVFEFVNEQGEVVTTATVPAQQLEAGGMAPLRLAPQGTGIVGWRYKVGTAS